MKSPRPPRSMQRACAMDLVETPGKSRQRLSSISDFGDVGGTGYVDDSGLFVGAPAVGLVLGAGIVVRGARWRGVGVFSSVASVAIVGVHHSSVESESLGDFVLEVMSLDCEGDGVCFGSNFGEMLPSGCQSDATMPYIDRSGQIRLRPSSDSVVSLVWLGAQIAVGEGLFRAWL